MRFYGQTDHNIQLVVDTVIKKYPKCKLVGIEPASMTCSLGGTAYIQRGDAKEVTLGFPTLHEAEIMHADTELIEFYHKYSAPQEPGSEFEVRRPGDVAF